MVCTVARYSSGVNSVELPVMFVADDIYRCVAIATLKHSSPT